MFDKNMWNLAAICNLTEDYNLKILIKEIKYPNTIIHGLYKYKNISRSLG